MDKFLPALALLAGVATIFLLIALALAPSRVKPTRSLRSIINLSHFSPAVLPALNADTDPQGKESEYKLAVEGLAVVAGLISASPDDAEKMVKEADGSALADAIRALAVLSSMSSDMASYMIIYVVDHRPDVADEMAKSNPALRAAIGLRRKAQEYAKQRSQPQASLPQNERDTRNSTSGLDADAASPIDAYAGYEPQERQNNGVAPADPPMLRSQEQAQEPTVVVVNKTDLKLVH